MKLLVLTLAACAIFAADIRLESAGGKSVFQVIDSSGGSFTVSVDTPDAQPMLGSTTTADGVVRFTPRFPLTAGMKYRATWKPTKGEPSTAMFAIPKPHVAPTTIVENVFPSARVLPENQLKFYVHFSAPMSKGEAYKHIHLLQADGKAVQLPFLEIDEELWDRDTQRLTLLFDPGRIKRGVLPLAEVGAAIKAGESYRLVIDHGWPDANGVPLRSGYEKQFTGGAADRTSPAIRSWRISAPTMGTSAPLIIEFPEPMERALAMRMIAVEGPGDAAIEGTVELEREETRWRFTPAAPWLAGAYKIKADAALEDLAGNKLNRLFDVDVFTKVDRTITTDLLSVPFTVAGK